MHAGIQMSPHEVIGSRDGCRHSIAESTVDVPIRLLRQIFSHREIEGEHWAQFARVRRFKQEHTLTERQSWGRRTIQESGW